MKKELCAFLAIVALVVISTAAYTRISKLTEQLFAHIDYAIQACQYEDFVSAGQELDKALQNWNNANDYTHVFIRHSEVDTASDIFYDALSSIHSHEKAEAMITLQKLRAHLISIWDMERLSIRSIF